MVAVRLPELEREKFGTGAHWAEEAQAEMPQEAIETQEVPLHSEWGAVWPTGQVIGSFSSSSETEEQPESGVTDPLSKESAWSILPSPSLSIPSAHWVGPSPGLQKLSEAQELTPQESMETHEPPEQVL